MSLKLLQRRRRMWCCKTCNGLHPLAEQVFPPRQSRYYTCTDRSSDTRAKLIVERFVYDTYPHHCPPTRVSTFEAAALVSIDPWLRQRCVRESSRTSGLLVRTSGLLRYHHGKHLSLWYSLTSHTLNDLVTMLTQIRASYACDPVMYNVVVIISVVSA